MILAETVAQTVSAPGDWSQIVAQFGFGAMVLYVVHRWLERIDHTLRGLSMALWTDLASRSTSSEYIREHAQKKIAQLEQAAKR